MTTPASALPALPPTADTRSITERVNVLIRDYNNPIAQQRLVPSGTVLPFAGTTAPIGFLLCSGQAVSRSTYSDLFAAIGTTYGAGDGSTTFNVPDIRARSIAGWDSGNATGRLNLAATGGILANTIGNVGGEQAHLLAIAEVPAHNHTAATVITDPGHHHAPPSGFSFLTTAASAGSFSGGTTSIPGASEAFTNTQTTGITATTTTSNAGSGTAHNVVQPTIILLPCIKIG
jgi:microcystin-dependent protein